MDILLHSVEILDPSSPWHRKKTNVRISNGIIAEMGEVQDGEMKIDAKDLKLSVGWFDMRASFGDPGFEYKEDIENGSRAAAAGGFTEIALLPNTQPVIQSKNEISYLRSRNTANLTQIHPIAAVTINTRGEELTEMIDLYKAGAVAFSDGSKPLWHTDICLKTLQYLQKFDGLLINRPEDRMLTAFGSMNEGINSTVLGLKGMPALAEELMIARDIKLLKYTGGRIHFATISSARSVELIRKAKAQGLNVSCDIAAHQIAFDDSFLMDFDTNYKVNPPLRLKEDIEALISGLEDQTIDVIVSGHTPHEADSKKLEFDLAEFGMIGLQTVYPVLQNISNRIPFENLIEKITSSPRKLLNLKVPEIKKGEKANLTLFDPQKNWVLDDKSNRSKSKNSPFYNQSLAGKAVGVFNQDKFILDDDLKINEQI